MSDKEEIKKKISNLEYRINAVFSMGAINRQILEQQDKWKIELEELKNALND